MTKLVPVSAKQMIKILTELGFKFQHQKGSHTVFRHEDGRTTTVPVHPGENLDRSLIRKILIVKNINSGTFYYVLLTVPIR